MFGVYILMFWLIVLIIAILIQAMKTEKLLFIFSILIMAALLANFFMLLDMVKF